MLTIPSLSTSYPPLAAHTAPAQPPLDPEVHYTTFQDEIMPIMEQYCYDCHMDGSDKGSLDLDKYTSFASMTQDRESWHKIKEHLDLKLMPPVDEPQPKTAETSRITSWIDNTILYVDPENPDPGKVVLRRLNRNEYQNTIQDLLGVTIDVEKLLPLDDTGYGFDTISDVHTVSPAHIEKYLTAAEIALNKATRIDQMPWAEHPFPINKLNYQPNEIKDGHFYISGTADIPTHSLSEGIYQLEIAASSTPAGNEEALLEIRDHHKVLAKVEIPHKSAETQTKLKVVITKDSSLTIAYTNDFYDPNHPDKSRRDRNIQLHELKLTGPLDGKRPDKPSSHQDLLPDRLASQTAEAYALEVWHTFANKAFRRPVNLSEIQPYTQFLTPSDETPEILQRQIILGMQAMLCSPHFLYIDSAPANPNKPVSPISELALASRLSYFLWSSTPDHTLLEKAKNNQLRTTLTEEIERMLDDPKAENFITNFSGQWLQLRDLDVISPDSRLFPQWNKNIKNDAISESQHFLRHLLKTNTSLLDCLDSNYSFLNERLANFYGIPGITGKHFRKVTFPTEHNHRGGLLTQLSVLTLTSYPDRTSPVLRGKWILENILGTAPPPPPGDIPSLEPDAKHNRSLSLRKQLEEHRQKAECAACHNLLDPLGFTLENYNAIGEWRLADKGKPIDTFGKLITGESFKNGTEMKSVLRKNKADDFLHCISEKLLTYSIGRGLEYYDKHALEDIITHTKKNNLTLRSLIHAVIHSTPFQQTRTENFNQ
ncbi:MAG: DUF1592 domain-containing protein [Akkermansiaceae bacterium]